MSITKSVFGKLPNGQVASLYTFSNSQGLTASITDWGGIITSLKVPDRQGSFSDITLGFSDPERYFQPHPYFGCLIGRVANRITRGQFHLLGEIYQLNTNDGANHLHGGLLGFDKKLWRSCIEGNKLRLDYLSVDGEENYPGNLQVTVWYSLDDENNFTIDYEAHTDKTTLVNLTNHTYFNLTGCKRDILSHDVLLHAYGFSDVDSSYLPSGRIILLPTSPAWDFSNRKSISQDISQVPGGYDHNYVLNKPSPEERSLSLAAEVYEPVSGRLMKMYTTELCVQFYTGNFLDGSVIGRDGVVYNRHFGFCLESQGFPDAINHSNLPSIVLEPGEVYRQSTIYEFLTL